MFELYFTNDDIDNAAHLQVNIKCVFDGDDPAVTYNLAVYSFGDDSITKDSGQIIPIE